MIKLRYQHLPLYFKLMRVERPIGTYLVAWPALWALWIAAKGVPDLKLLLVFLCGAFLMRSAGCVINDFADRQIDGRVARTKDRPLVNKLISGYEAIQLFILLCFLSALLLFFTNKFTACLSLGAIFLASAYPFMKRYTHLPQVILGMAFSWAIPMAFAAQINHIPNTAWGLYLAVVIWVVAYDTFYAMVDREDDLNIGVKSTAILFGRFDRLITALLQLTFIFIMLALGHLLNTSFVYFIGIGLAAVLFIYQQWLITERIKQRCFNAFLNNHYVGMVVFIGIACNYSPFFA